MSEAKMPLPEDICIDDLPAALLERLSQKEERRRKALAGFSPRLHPRRGRRGGERGREGEDTAAQVRHRRHEVCLVLSPPKSDLNCKIILAHVECNAARHILSTFGQ